MISLRFIVRIIPINLYLFIHNLQACGSRLLLKAAVRNVWLQFLFFSTLFGVQPVVFTPANTCVDAEIALSSGGGSSGGGAYFSGTKSNRCQRGIESST